MVWRESARSYLQALYGIACVGAISGPLVANPFLARKTEVTSSVDLGSDNDLDLMYPDNTSEVLTSMTSDSNILYNYTGSLLNSTGLAYVSGNWTIVPLSTDPVLVYGESRIYIPYAISGMCCALCAVLFVVITLLHGSVYDHSLSVVRRASEYKVRTYTLSAISKNILTVLIAFAILMYLLLERGMTQFVMTFVLNALNWTKTDGSMATGIFWATIAGGRLTSILVVNKLKTPVVLAIYLTISGLGVAMFSVGSFQDIRYLIFVSIGVSGLGMSVILGTMFSILSEKVRPLTGKVSAVFFVTNSIGGMVFPLLLGYLMEEISPMTFVYCETILYLIIVAVVALIFLLIKTFNRRQKIKRENEESGACAIDR